eukprot:SAG11_NODE_5803_length_1460_cov_2.835415_1_plen_57_part_10
MGTRCLGRALGVLKMLEPHLLQLPDLMMSKLLKAVVDARMQFESGHGEIRREMRSGH